MCSFQSTLYIRASLPTYNTTSIYKGAHAQYAYRPDRLANDDGHLDWICGQLQRRLGELNQAKFQEVQSHLRAAIDCVVSGVRYRFMQANGELLNLVTAETPIVNTCAHLALYLVQHSLLCCLCASSSYFTFRYEERDMARVEALMDNPDTAKHIMACNGWVMNDDPLRNFAEEGESLSLSRATRALLLRLSPHIRNRLSLCNAYCIRAYITIALSTDTFLVLLQLHTCTYKGSLHVHMYLTLLCTRYNSDD